jgi:hypothetical protein
MSSTPDLSSILDDLAAGRIDSAEASRRIDAATRNAEQTVEPDGGPASASDDVPSQSAQTGPADEAADGDAGPASGADDSADDDSTSDGTDGSRHGFFEEPWNRMPPEAREGLRSAWHRIAGAAEQVADAAGGARGAAAPGAGHTSGGPAASAQASGPGGEIQRVRVRCVGRRVTIIGDPATPGVKVEGEHTRRRMADTVEITSKSHIGPDLSGLLRFRFPKDAEDFKDLGLGPELVIRMHPDLVLDIELSGGALRLSGMPEVDAVRVTAGAADIADLHQVGDALFQLGGATVTGPIDRGRSRIRAESSNVTVNLAESSNVAVRADVQTGLISWPDGGSEVDEYVVGNGSARLDLSAVMGRIAVRQTR